MNKNNIFFKLFISIAFCLGMGWLSGLATEHSISTWYPTLIKPSWNPANYVFPIVWTVLYVMMGISFWLIWTNPHKDKIQAYAFFGIQLFLNFIWSWLFFYLENPALGLVDIVLLWLAISATILSFYKLSKLSAWLLVPYFLWITYAISLNFYIWVKN